MEYLTFGPGLHRRRCEFLNDIASARSVLILGDGDGRFTAEFLRRNPSAFVHSLESSESMSRLASARIATVPKAASRVCQIVKDARTAELIGRYDLVVSHFFLDCFTTRELEHLIPRITAHVHPGGRWIVSEFQIPPSGFRRYLARVVINALYLSFQFLTGLETEQLPDYGRVLERNGYFRTAAKAGVADMLVSEIWERA